jgi:hypothetical protein
MDQSSDTEITIQWDIVDELKRKALRASFNEVLRKENPAWTIEPRFTGPDCQRSLASPSLQSAGSAGSCRAYSFILRLKESYDEYLKEPRTSQYLLLRSSNTVSRDIEGSFLLRAASSSQKTSMNPDFESIRII